MSAVPCPVTLTSASYPPVKNSIADKVRLVQIQQLKEQAPFGRSPKQQAPINAAQYKNAMAKEIASAEAIDLRWPFWLGVGLGGVGLVVLLAKR